MTDHDGLVECVWGGPFVAHVLPGLKTVTHGESIWVTAAQAKENPVWYQPLPHKPKLSHLIPDEAA